jgi:hypothetical protein
MDEKSLKPKYEAPRIISMEEIGSSIGGDQNCGTGDGALNCNIGTGGLHPLECNSGATP